MIMVFLSGVAGLIYEILWMRQLGLLLGNTAHAAAVTLAVFFGGLAAGSWLWGRRVSSAANPLRTYARLEIGVAVTALLYFLVLRVFYWGYPAVYQSVGSGTWLLLIKCLFATALVFPAAFCMGGTIPAMGQYMVTRKEQFGATAARLYGINTAGAALGAFLAAFWCVPHLGFNMTCLLAVAISGTVGAVAYRLSMAPAGQGTVSDRETAPAPVVSRKMQKKMQKKQKGEPASNAQSVPPLGMGRRTICFIACLSGFSVLALEVLWTRMFAQIHENSVYSFATVLIIVLVCLSVGALLASRLARTKVSPRHLMAVLMLLGGVTLLLFPSHFLMLTDNLSMLSTDGTFSQYVKGLFGIGFATIGPVSLILGMVFPFLMKGEERFADHPGRSIGTISAVNTVGAILGSLLCGFVFLRVLGMWWTVQTLAALYLLAATIVAGKSRPVGVSIAVTSVVVLILGFAVMRPSSLPRVGVDLRLGDQKVVALWETSDCTVSVVEHDQGHRTIKVNSNYNLGSTAATPQQMFQGRIPMFIYPQTEDLFFLGLGTGITAGAVLDKDVFPAVKRVVVCELVPEVVTAASRYMAGGEGGHDHTDGLFEDPRVEILVEDGRHYLMATDATFDMINADLFLPYRSGAGSLYSREHFQCAKRRLKPGGVLVQWLPLYQVTDDEFGVISRTMLSVFDQVTLWRNNFQPGGEIVAIVGHRDQTPLPACELRMTEDKVLSIRGKDWRSLDDLLLPFNEQTASLFYCGNMTAAKHLFDGYAINTDDRPLIEYMAPRSLRKKSGDMLPPTFIGPRLADLVDQLLEISPPEQDPMLANRTAENRRLPLAGAALHRAWVEYAMGDARACRRAWATFVTEWINHGAAAPHAAK
jgi:spermidine synthase